MDKFIDNSVIDKSRKLLKYITDKELIELHQTEWVHDRCLIIGSVVEKFAMTFGVSPSWSFIDYFFESDLTYERDMRYAILSKKVSDMPKGVKPTEVTKSLRLILNAEMERQIKIPWHNETRIIARSDKGYTCILSSGEDIGYLTKKLVGEELNRRRAKRPVLWKRLLSRAKGSTSLTPIRKFSVSSDLSSAEDIKRLLSKLSRVRLAEMYYSDWDGRVKILGDPTISRIVFPNSGDDKWSLFLKEKIVYRRLTSKKPKGDLLDQFLGGLNQSIWRLLSSDLKKDSELFCHFIYHTTTNEVVYSFSYPIAGYVTKDIVASLYKSSKKKVSSFLRDNKQPKTIKLKLRIRK
jgi:hypothetical protein